MKSHLKINQFSSNKAIYSQVILNNKVISSNKESLFNVLNTSTKILVKDEEKFSWEYHKSSTAEN